MEDNNKKRHESMGSEKMGHMNNNGGKAHASHEEAASKKAGSHKAEHEEAGMHKNAGKGSKGH